MIKTDGELFNFALKNYSNPTCKTAEEFSLDYNIPSNISRLLTRRVNGEDINFRLVLNYFVMMLNVFNPYACVIIMFKKIDQHHHPALKSVFTFLNYLPDSLSEINIEIANIPYDEEFVEFLRKL